VLPAREMEQAAVALVERVYDAEWTRKAGINAKRLAQEKFDRDKLAEELETVLIRAAKVDCI